MFVIFNRNAWDYRSQEQVFVFVGDRKHIVRLGTKPSLLLLDSFCSVAVTATDNSHEGLQPSCSSALEAARSSFRLES